MTEEPIEHHSATCTVLMIAVTTKNLTADTMYPEYTLNGALCGFVLSDLQLMLRELLLHTRMIDSNEHLFEGQEASLCIAVKAKAEWNLLDQPTCTDQMSLRQSQACSQSSDEFSSRSLAVNHSQMKHTIAWRIRSSVRRDAGSLRTAVSEQ